MVCGFHLAKFTTRREKVSDCATSAIMKVCPNPGTHNRMAEDVTFHAGRVPERTAILNEVAGCVKELVATVTGGRPPASETLGRQASGLSSRALQATGRSRLPLAAVR